MNSKDFQNICQTLHAKYDRGTLTDADVDAFADVVTNVLGRDDLREEGSEYAMLAGRLDHDYENDINMNPLLARMYELCRMYAMYRPRPLTEMERKDEQAEVGRVLTKRYPASILVTAGRRVISSCWWEDLDGMDEISRKVEVLAESLPALPDERASDDRDVDDETLRAMLDAFAKVDAGLDPLDVEVAERMSRVSEIPVPISDEPECGIVALDSAGIERNRERKGAIVRMDVASREVTMDAYTVYGAAFYKRLIGMDADAHLPAMEELRDEDVSFAFADAASSCADWRERLADAFAIPGSKELVGTKKPIAVN